MTPIGLSSQIILNGDTYEWTFSEAVLQIETDNDGTQYCGDRQYKIYRSVADGSAEVTGDWITITGPDNAGTYKVLAEPIDDSLVTGGSLELVFEIILTGQPNNMGYTEQLDVEIQSAVCDCNLLTWDNPASATEITVPVASTQASVVPEASVNSASRSTTPQIRVCYFQGNTCDETYVNTLVAVETGTLPSFISYSA